MADYHRLIDEPDRREKDCYDENREAHLSEFERSNSLRRNEKLDSSILTLIFIHNFVTNILINFDHGTIPAALTVIKTELRIDNANMGI